MFYSWGFFLLLAFSPRDFGRVPPALVVKFCLKQRIHQPVLESQIPHKTVN